MALINCTINSTSVTVTKDSALGSTANQVLTITPNTGYVVKAADFTNNSGTVTGISSITLTDSGTAYADNNTILVTCDLDNSYTPTASATWTIDIDGEALDKKARPYTLAGTWDQVVNSNVTASAVTNANSNAYSASGIINEEDIIIEQTYTCDSGYYFTADPTFVKTSVGTYADNYLVDKTYITYTNGQLTAIKYKITWKNPGTNVSGHNVDFSANAVAAFHTQTNLITGIVINADGLKSNGETRKLKIYGNVGASFKLFIRDDGATDPADTWYNFTTDLFTGTSESYSSNFVIDSSGIYEMDIIFPAQNVNPTETYFISVIGGTSPATNTVQGSTSNNDAFTQTLTQVDDISITMTASGTALNVTTMEGGSDEILNIPANSVNIDSNGNMLGGDVKWDITVTSTTPGKVLQLRRQPVFTEDTAYNTSGTMDFTNGEADSNNGTIWHIDNLEATGDNSATIRIQTGTSTNSSGGVVNGFFWDTSGTASVTSNLNLDNIINIAPVTTSQTYNGTEDNALVINLSAHASDANSDTLTYSVVSDGTGANGTLGSINASTGAITYTPAANNNTNVSFTWKVNDGHEDSNTSTATLAIAAVNDAPTDIALSAATQAENTAINTTIGAFSTTDVDAGDTFTYTLVSGTGSTDNASFNISGANLRNSAVFDYETKSSYAIRVRSTDAAGLYFEKQFTITVTDVSEGTTYRLDIHDSGGTYVSTLYVHGTQICDGTSLAVTCMDLSTLTNKWFRWANIENGTPCTNTVYGRGKLTGATSTGLPTAYIKGDTYYNSNNDSHNNTNGVTC